MSWKLLITVSVWLPFNNPKPGFFIMKKEIWKDIPEYEGYYQISNLGRLKTLKREGFILNDRIRKSVKDQKGYLKLGLNKNNKKKMFRISRLVAEAFIPNPNNYPQINHKDGNKQNNHYKNLEWCNNSQNRIHGFRTGLIKKPIGELNPNSKLTLIQINQIRILKNLFTINELSKIYNITYQQIRNIIQYKNWK